jgi:hypothetical protein
MRFCYVVFLIDCDDMGKRLVSIMVDSIMKGGDQSIVTTIDDIISCSESDLLNCCVNDAGDFNVFDEADCNLDGMENCETFTDFSDLMLVRKCLLPGGHLSSEARIP